MKKDKSDAKKANGFRERAEEIFGARGDRDGANAGGAHVAPELQRLVHELQVHQIELELQNEELQRTRAEVEQALSRYTDLYEFAPVGYLTLNLRGEVQQVNLTGAHLFGLERSRLVGERLALLVDVDSRSDFEAFLTKALSAESTESCEVVVRPELASPFAVEFAGTSAVGGTECRVVATDITARKRSEALLAIRVRLQEMASSHSSKEILQRTLDEVETITGSQTSFFHYLEPDQRTPSLQVWSARTSGSRDVAREWQRDRDDPNSAWADCLRERVPITRNMEGKPPSRKGASADRPQTTREVVVPIFRKDKIVAILGASDRATPYTEGDISSISYLADVAWEIAERRRVEQEREDLQQQLAQAQKMEAIGTLAGGIAHDFNNILAGILGGLSLLELTRDVGGDDRADIREMKALVNRGSALSKQLVGFARRGKYDLKPIDLLRVTARTSSMYGRTRPDITIELDFATDLLPVLMDHSQLELVLLNLLVNAGQSMPEGGRLSLRAENADLQGDQGSRMGIPPGLFTRLVIADTGSGMDGKTMSRIFEPFFTTKGSGQGTGLGLASVYGVIKNHAGFIGVESELGKGTAFTLLLPATNRPVEDDAPPLAAIQRGTGTILVVDDEEQMLKVYARLLHTLGYHVLTAPGGRQAVELVRQHQEKISLVILDMIMPDMSGRQTFEAIRKIRPNIKVLISTGNSIEGHAQELLNRGCNGLIQKPFEAEAFAAKVRELI
jgi:PAS domain S-box-containing protein